MSKAIGSALLAAVLTIPAVAFAQQPNASLTRAEVRAELVQLEKAGYQPSHVSPYYPADIEAAVARVQANNNANAAGSTVAAMSSDKAID
jgi:hypothetical protein